MIGQLVYNNSFFFIFVLSSASLYVLLAVARLICIPMGIGA